MLAARQTDGIFCPHFFIDDMAEQGEKTEISFGLEFCFRWHQFSLPILIFGFCINKNKSSLSVHRKRMTDFSDVFYGSFEKGGFLISVPIVLF